MSTTEQGETNREYQTAMDLAERGELTSALELLLELQSTGDLSNKLAHLVGNDVGVLRGALGDHQTAERQLEELADAFPLAKTNLNVLRSGQHEQSSGCVAILSFLFNWPSTGGGIIHTVELSKFLREAGYEVHVIHPIYEGWKIGNVAEDCPIATEPIVFSKKDWNRETIKRRFRERVDEVAPSTVIITDCWNFKPHLAEAMDGYDYIFRMQALECICPLNNLRLLPAPGGKLAQCPESQLTNPKACRLCLDRFEDGSGDLHRVDRELSGVKEAGYSALLRRSMKNAKAVLALNSEIGRLLATQTPKAKVVTWGMDPSRFENIKRTPNEKRQVILFSGLHHESMKGFVHLLAACRTLWGKRQDFVLRVTGLSEDLGEPFVEGLPWMSQGELPQLYADAAVLVVPSVAQEGLSRTAVEAMAAGCPVIGSAIGGLKDIILDGETGYLVAPGDEETLAERIDKVLTDKDHRDKLGSAGRKRFESTYTWQSVIDNNYRPLLAKSSESHMKPFTPFIPSRIEHEQLQDEIQSFFQLDEAEIRELFQRYRDIHEKNHYEATLGELKTLSFEEAFVIFTIFQLLRPSTVAELGVQHGKSLRRMIDMSKRLEIDTRFVGFDLSNDVQHVRSDEFSLELEDLTGRFSERVLGELKANFVFHDAHPYALIRESLDSCLASKKPVVLAIHDCGKGLCNPVMTLSRNDPHITSRTGHWERHVIAETFGIQDVLSDEVNEQETETHRFRIFDTQHGLCIVWPKALDGIDS